MASEDLRRRLEALNGGPLANAAREDAREEPAARRERRLGKPPSGPVEPAVIAPASPERRDVLAASLARHVGGESRELKGGRGYYHVQKSVVADGTLCSERAASIGPILESASFRDHMRRPATALASEVLFLDLETLGLHGEPLFLIGLLSLTAEGGADCIQLLARGPDEESAILDRCAGYLRSAKLLLSYNGKSFDVPFLKARYERHGMRCPRIPPHVDLLVEARIRYRGRFRDCKLQTLERHLCGRTRDGDVPGARIPAVYRTCIESGDAEPLASILLHNRLDLATTAELVTHFWGA
jgi:uncharacterized protein YprB with RNaseH-like and TPR domain